MDLEKLRQELLTLKARIATLEAQIKEPEWVPFPGELIEVRDGEDREWMIDRFIGINEGMFFPVHCRQCGWKEARPLSDPNIIQLRPHTPGDPMPCDGDQKAIVRRKPGIEIGLAKAFDWGTWPDAPIYQITAWAPLPKVSP